jgi:iron complex outermembrane receptor protein
VLAAAALGGSAIAQEKTTMLEEIVVTAQKRSENLQEVPIAISAYTSKTRELIGITTIQDLTNFTPGLSYSTALDRASIRGIGRNTNNLASEAGVATYLDGFYSTSTVSAASSPMQVERVEVLRGPQGTLYGRNSIGGTINTISKKPTSSFYGEGRLAYESYDRQVVEAAVSGPLADWLRVRLYGNNTNQDGGYYHNVSGGPDEGGVTHAHYVELQVAMDFGSSVEAWLKGSWYGYNNAGRTSSFVGSYDYSKVPVGSLSQGVAYGLLLPGSNYSEQGTGITQNPTAQHIRDFATNTPASQVLTDAPTFVGHLTWHLSGVDIKYVGGFARYKYDQTSDYDGTPVNSYTVPLTAPGAGDVGTPCSASPGCSPLRLDGHSVNRYTEDKQYYSNELNFSSSGDGRIQWIGGLYQYSEEYTQPVNFPSQNPAFISPRGITPGAGPFGSALIGPAGSSPSNPSTSVYYIDQHTYADSLAGFGQVDWSILDSLKLTLGARYTEDKRHGTEFTRQLCYGLTYYVYGCGDLGVYGTNAVATDVTKQLIYIPAPGDPASPGATGVATVDTTTGIWSRGLKGKWSATTGTAGVEWNPSADMNVYGKYSRGYKAGGFNAGTIQKLPETDPEYVDAFEAGAKFTLGGQLQMNLAAFYYDYQGMQIPLTVQPTTSPAITSFFNMDVKNYGAELETVWQPTSELQVLFNYAYLSTAIQSECDAALGLASVCLIDNNDPQAKDPQANQAGPLLPSGNQAQSVQGQQVPQSPANKASLNVNYRFDFSPGSLTLSVSDTWKDSTYFSLFNRSYNLAPAYSQVDVRATWTDTENRYSIVGYVRNAANSLGYDGYNGGVIGNTNAIGGPRTVGETISLTPPRVFGIQVQYRVGSTK